MTNPTMEFPTAAQDASIADAMAALETAERKANNIRAAIGSLRRQLNDARLLLSFLKEVIGPQAYGYHSNETWHARISKAVANIDAALK